MASLEQTQSTSLLLLTLLGPAPTTTPPKNHLDIIGHSKNNIDLSSPNQIYRAQDLMFQSLPIPRSPLLSQADPSRVLLNKLQAQVFTIRNSPKIHPPTFSAQKMTHTSHLAPQDREHMTLSVLVHKVQPTSSVKHSDLVSNLQDSLVQASILTIAPQSNLSSSHPGRNPLMNSLPQAQGNTIFLPQSLFLVFIINLLNHL